MIQNIKFFEKTKKLIRLIYCDAKNLKNSFFYNFSKSNYPTALQLSITGKCNSHCVMCNVWKNQTKKELTPEELSIILQNKLFKKIKGVGVNGGEPTLRKDLCLIIRVIIKNLKNLKSLTILTNCVNSKEVSEKIKIAYDECEKNNINFFALLSLDGINKIHDLNRGTKGNFKNFEQIKKFLECNNIPFGAGMTITPINCYYVDDVFEYCVKNNIKKYKFRIGVDIKRIFNDGYEKNNTFSENQLFHLKNFFQKLTMLPGTKNNIFYKSLFGQLAYGKKRLAGCGWQKRGVTLGPNGEISYCSVKSPILGNAQKKSAFNLYKNNFNIRKNIIKNYCHDCKHDLSGPLSLKNVFLTILNNWILFYNNFKKQFQFKFKKQINSKVKNKKIYYPNEYSVKKWKNILITGWYGTETAGDKAILGELLHFLNKINPNINIYITSYNKYITQKTFDELNNKYKKIIPIHNIPKKIVKISDAIIIGGGPLMEIAELKYIRDAFLSANNRYTDRIIFGCGINPNLSNRYAALISDIVKLSTKSFFRDKESYLLAKKYEIGGKFGYSCDPSIAYLDRLIKKMKIENQNSNCITTLLRANTLEYLKINDKELTKKNKKFSAIAANTLNNIIKEKNCSVKLLPMHSIITGGDDRLYNREIAKELNINYSIERNYLTLKQLILKINDSKIAISMRYHGHLFPFALGIPFVSIDYTSKNGKVHNFLNKINYHYSIPWEEVNNKNLYKKINEVFNNREKIRTQITQEKNRLLKQLNSNYNDIFKIKC